MQTDSTETDKLKLRPSRSLAALDRAPWHTYLLAAKILDEVGL